MLLVQEFIKNRSLDDLIREHGVYASASKDATKISLNYDQIEAKESDILAQQCRGLILSKVSGKFILNEKDKVDTTQIVGETLIQACPMFRFFNNGQGACADIDWTDPQLQVLEKLDGTLTIVYFDKLALRWCVATRSVSEADIQLEDTGFTFRTLFEKAVHDCVGLTFDKFTQSLNPNYTYCFELTSPYNRIIVKYQETKITLLSVRDNTTLQEVNLDTIKCPVAKVYGYPLRSITEIIDFVNNLNPLEHEGVVIKDSKFRRIKVKNINYTLFNGARDSLGASDRNCLELILNGREDDVIPAMPEEIANNLRQIKEQFVRFLQIQESTFKDLKSQSSSKKEFANLVNQLEYIWAPLMFALYDNKVTDIKDYLNKIRNPNKSYNNSILDRLLYLIKKS